MSNPTDITPAQVIQTAEAHLSSAETIKSLQNNMADNVQQLHSTSRGSTMTRFMHSQEEWSQDVTDILGILNEMGGYMKQAANTVQQRDQS